MMQKYAIWIWDGKRPIVKHSKARYPLWEALTLIEIFRHIWPQIKYLADTIPPTGPVFELDAYHYSEDIKNLIDTYTERINDEE